MSDTSHIGSLYQSELARRGMPINADTISQLVLASRSNPGIIPGLDGVQGLDPVAQATPRSQSTGQGQVGSPALPIPPIPPSAETQPPPAAVPPAPTSSGPDAATIAGLIAAGAGVGGGNWIANKLTGQGAPAPAPAPTAPIPPQARAGMPGSTGGTLTPNAPAPAPAPVVEGPPGTVSASPPEPEAPTAKPTGPKITSPNAVTMSTEEHSFFTKAFQDGIKNGMSTQQAQERAANILRQFKAGRMPSVRLR